MTVTVACVWVRGNVPFTVDYVAKLHAMVTRHLPRPLRFVCLTDRPREVPSCVEPIVVETICPQRAWWTKTHLFDPRMPFDGRVLYLDLDVLVLGGLEEIIDYPQTFAIVPDDAPNFRGRGRLRVVKRFNSSVMVWDAGVANGLFTYWTPEVAERLWGDQDWIGEMCIDLKAMPLPWFPRLSQARSTWSADAKVVLCKKPKNAEAAARWPWFKEAWG